MAFRAAAKVREPAADVGGRIERAIHAGNEAFHRISETPERREHPEYRFIGGIVTDEYRTAMREGRTFHQLANRLSLVEAGRLDLDDGLAVHDLEVLDGNLRNNGSDLVLEEL